MSSSSKIVDDLMLWLNQTYCLSLPLLPLTGWPAAVVTLWNKVVDWLPGEGPPPQTVVVEGTWKPFGSGNFEFEELRINIYRD
ncbi:hypothetical protein Misp06_02925 [Microbulbifer sp. NBRC 101763]|uniref:hypothetical protein n=1 Tax=Microbulbifer sp. NBRC 101763 TaxID=1113820 RepID=UPI0030A403E4